MPIQKELAPQKIIIHRGEGINEISEKLVKLGLIRNKTVFQLYVYLKGLRTRFQPGEYSLSSNLNIGELIRKLTSQFPSQEKQVTFPEGWTSKEMASRLDAFGLVKKEDFLKVVNSPAGFANDFDFLKDKPSKASLEGYLFPDTYRFYLETKIEDVIRKILNNFSKKFTLEMRQEANRQKRSIFEIVTLASLLEKEADTEEDRQLIADIFWRRLAKNIPLQSCATINYLLGTSKRNLSLEETKTPSPYNTYLNVGLPPGPINNPGLVSIKAALWPKENNYWFFLATKEGQTVFSQTKEEHDAAKQKYLK